MSNLPQPRKAAFNIGGLRSATSQIGSGGGGGGGEGRFLNVAHKTGVATVGKDGEPFNTDVLYGVRPEELRFGYFLFNGKDAPDKSNMIPLVSGRPKPVPADGVYAQYPEPGARDMLEIKLHPVDGSGAVEFSPTGISSQNRIAALVEQIVMQESTPAGQVGFTFPIIECYINSWDGKYGVTHHWDYRIKDWTDASGELLQSAWEQTDRVEGLVVEEDAEFDPLG